MDRLSLREQHTVLQEGFSSDEGESGNTQGCLLFQYFAQDQSYGREPLADKILDLARCFPELKTLRSCDLLSSSWISVLVSHLQNTSWINIGRFECLLPDFPFSSYACVRQAKLSGPCSDLSQRDEWNSQDFATSIWSCVVQVQGIMVDA
ncbi:R-peptide like [Actinidia chinensis var. chinensis]|uniref:R-peptide like n=1 Tax=Actinidia chinensis var. chinensis TaxID=1590841 RepID=A0A2R6PBA7_ACTCC|nr:R-peptide like [Actinidia chinensis var. chinensis]